MGVEGQMGWGTRGPEGIKNRKARICTSKAVQCLRFCDREPR
ncbi:hypothetical protein P3T37_002793 [Kitasatospora sp. MAA4]|nr:hypothetical protein [Kitasatospora sp. MAA4]